MTTIYKHHFYIKVKVGDFIEVAGLASESLEAG
jgi:hypothetical protein